MILCFASIAFGARGAYGDDLGVFDALNYDAESDGQFDDSNVSFLKFLHFSCVCMGLIKS